MSQMQLHTVSPDWTSLQTTQHTCPPSTTRDAADEERTSPQQTANVSTLEVSLKTCLAAAQHGSESATQSFLPSGLCAWLKAAVGTVTRLWESQPYICNKPAGNLLLSAENLFSGGCPVPIPRMLQLINVEIFCACSFFDYQWAYLLPAIKQC